MRNVLVAAVLVVLAACANSEGPGMVAPGQVDTSRLDPYEALIRNEVRSEPGADWRTIFVLVPICANAGAPAEPKGCDDAFSAEEQTALVQRLSDLGAPLTFVTKLDHRTSMRIMTGKERAIVLRLGPLAPQRDGSLHIPASYTCGGLCGSGSTHVLELQDGRWVVTGSAGGSWMA